jgi:PST family polysaccharide transporter
MLHRAFHAVMANPFARNLSSMGGAQLAIRLTRLLTTIILSRLLSPNDYGLAAVVLTVYELVALFTRNGISAKVVQASGAEVETVARTAHSLTWLVCGALVLIQAALALPIAWFYRDPRLALPIALMGLIYLATPLSNIQGAFMQREGRLGRIALTSAIQVMADNILTALFALCGLGMWAIILPKLLVAPIWTIGVRTGHPWRPAGWSLIGWRDIARFSRNVIGVELMTTVQANIDNLIVGSVLGVEALGLYYFAYNAGLGITLGLVNAFGTAVYPHLCEVRADSIALADRYRRTLRTMGGLVVPLILAQAFLAPVYVPIVFGAKWAPAIPVLMLICLSALPRPFATTCSQLLKAVGRPDIELRWQAGLTVLLIAGLLIGTRVGIVGVAAAVLAVQSVVLTAYILRAPRPFLRAIAAPVVNFRRDGAKTILLMGFEDLRWGTVRMAKPLREAGFRVAALCPAGNPLAHSSFVERHFPVRDVRNLRRIEASLVAAMRSWQPTLIVPADEQVVACLHALVRRPAMHGKHRLNADEQAIIAHSLGDPACFDAMLLKSETVALARRLNIRVPRGKVVTAAAEAAAAAEQIGFPVYLKTSFSWGGRGVHLCRDRAAVERAATGNSRRHWVVLRDAVRRLLDRAWYPTDPVMKIQQAIVGTPAMFCCVALDGKMLAGFGGIALETSTPDGPSTMVRLGQGGEMEQAAATMIGAFKATGFIGFDFMIEAETGHAYLIECNPRPIQVGHLGPRIGVDLCGALAAGLAGEPNPPTTCQAEETIALFPQEWVRNHGGLNQIRHHIDVPWDDEPLLKMMIATYRTTTRTEATLPIRVAPVVAPCEQAEFSVPTAATNPVATREPTHE